MQNQSIQTIQNPIIFIVNLFNLPSRSLQNIELFTYYKNANEQTSVNVLL